MHLKNLFFAVLALGALNASAQHNTENFEEDSPRVEKIVLNQIHPEHKKGLVKISIGPTWTNAMVLEKFELPMKNEEAIVASLNAYSPKWNYHLMYNSVNQSVSTLNGYRFSEKHNLDVFIFLEKNLSHDHSYASIGVQETCRLGDCEDFFVIFFEAGTDFKSDPMFKFGVSIIPQFTLWKR